MLSEKAKEKWKQTPLAYLYVSPALLIMLGLVVWPIIYTFIISFTNLSLFHWENYEFVGFRNYGKVLGNINGDFYVILLRTVLWTLFNVIIQLVVAMILALVLNMKNLKCKVVYRTLLILPWAIPTYISGLIWKGMFNRDFGAINLLLESMGMQKVAWLSTPLMGLISSGIANVWLAIPFMMIVCLGALQSIVPSLDEAAEIDGSSKWNSYWNITLPLMKPALLPAIILTTFVTFKQFDLVYLMTKGMNGQTDLVITYVYNKAFVSNNYSYASAFSVVVFAILLLLVIWTQKWLMKMEEVY